MVQSALDLLIYTMQKVVNFLFGSYLVEGVSFGMLQIPVHWNNAAKSDVPLPTAVAA